ncbi:type II secretion system protein [Clostridium sp. AWRP]|uniref:type II secretion system protein n=1 Tax=Clostridium sp. AWRP TaxID=2212991 RepID=UPI000FDBDFE7|nr:type II secretion system protein [Clostridium sp. AWRP]AZV55561.1 type II secretion system protein [Clostridium sp. AWRP]
MENVMKLEKKKGFTLIELMIVLAIIAILAVVLIPKSQIFKNNSKNAGVTTNVNTVRGYLETKVTNSGGADSYLNAATLKTAIASNFSLDSSTFVPTGSSSSEQLVNPFNKDNASVSVVDKSSDETNNKVDTVSPSSTGVNDGEVVIYVCKDGYVVFGVDKGGDLTQTFKVK